MTLQKVMNVWLAKDNMELIEGVHYKIHDNFLSEENHGILQNTMLSNTFPWFYQNDIIGQAYATQVTDIDNSFFCHIFYDKGFVNSQLFDIITPLVRKINAFSLFRIKANLYPKTKEFIHHGFHTDYLNLKQKTGIYYINTNNGKTIFKDGLIVESIANRFIEFDTDLLHESTTCTDTKIRCNINFNYMLL